MESRVEQLFPNRIMDVEEHIFLFARLYRWRYCITFTVTDRQKRWKFEHHIFFLFTRSSPTHHFHLHVWKTSSKMFTKYSRTRLLDVVIFDKRVMEWGGYGAFWPTLTIRNALGKLGLEFHLYEHKRLTFSSDNSCWA